jgi:hypothetical protein
MRQVLRILDLLLLEHPGIHIQSKPFTAFEPERGPQQYPGRIVLLMILVVTSQRVQRIVILIELPVAQEHDSIWRKV